MKKLTRRIYNRKWEEIRAKFLRFNPRCMVKGCKRPALHVDHVVPVEVDPERRMDWMNLQALCQPCHNRLTKAYDAGSIRGACDAEGTPLDPHHPWHQASNMKAIEVTNEVQYRVDPLVAARLKRAASRGMGGGGRVGK